MATGKQIINASKKTDESLSKIQSDHIKAVQKSMELLNKKLIDASKMLETDPNGLLVSDKVAFLQAQKLHTKIESLYATEFTDTMKEQISKLNEVKQVIRTNFSDLGSSTKFTDIDNKMMDALQDSYYADFVSLSDTNKNKVVQAMYNQVIVGSPYSELVDTITNAVSGLQSQTGRSLSQYATLYTRDMVMNFHNSVTLKKAEDEEFDTFLYMGTVMKRSRAFCIERVGKAYTKQQIDSWTFGWAGKSGPAMTHRGGYNCRHHWQPVKKEWLTDEELSELSSTNPSTETKEENLSTPINKEEYNDLSKSKKSIWDQIDDLGGSLGRCPDSLYNYAGEGYRKINSGLRSDEGLSSLDEKTTKIVIEIDNLLSKNTLNSNLVLRRGTSFDSSFFSDIQSQLEKVGTIIEDKGFCSTTINEVDNSFMRGEYKVSYTIYAKKGSNGLFLPRYDSVSKSEGEVLLPRSSKFKILSFTEKESKKYELELELL